MSENIDTFSSEFFGDNRKRLRSLFQGTAPIVLTANGLMQQSTDATYPFKQDGNFWYLTGLDHQDLILVMDKDKEYLILPEQSDYQMDFHGVLEPSKITARSGIVSIFDNKSGWKQLSNRIKKVQHLATLAPPPAFVDVYGFYSNPARSHLAAKIKSYNNDIELLDLRKHFGLMRMIKQPVELVAIQKAIDITAKTLKSIKRKISKYDFEYQIEADLSYGFRMSGADGHAFDPIIASGGNACIVHYLQNNCKIKSKDLVLLDVGAQYDGYAADISRTYAVGQISTRQQKVYEAVKDVQEFAYSLIKPGVIRLEYEKQVEQYMGEKLRSLGLIRNVEREEIRKYFPHATSHFMGYDVHDVGDYERVFEAGIVLTVEPGIYIPEENIGVRIEDDVLITDDGIKILSANIPSDL